MLIYPEGFCDKRSFRAGIFSSAHDKVSLRASYGASSPQDELVAIITALAAVLDPPGDVTTRPFLLCWNSREGCLRELC